MVAEIIKQLHAAIGEYVDWVEVRSAKMTLDGYADTEQKRLAVKRLANAVTADEVRRAATGISVAFAGPLLFDDKGYPKRNPDYQPETKRKRRH